MHTSMASMRLSKPSDLRLSRFRFLTDEASTALPMCESAQSRWYPFIPKYGLTECSYSAGMSEEVLGHAIKEIGVRCLPGCPFWPLTQMLVDAERERRRSHQG